MPSPQPGGNTSNGQPDTTPGAEIIQSATIQHHSTEPLDDEIRPLDREQVDQLQANLLATGSKNAKKPIEIVDLTTMPDSPPHRPRLVPAPPASRRLQQTYRPLPGHRPSPGHHPPPGHHPTLAANATGFTLTALLDDGILASNSTPQPFFRHQGRPAEDRTSSEAENELLREKRDCVRRKEASREERECRREENRKKKAYKRRKHAREAIERIEADRQKAVLASKETEGESDRDLKDP